MARSLGVGPWEAQPPLCIDRIKGADFTRRGEVPPHPKGGTPDPHAFYIPAGSSARRLERGRPLYWLWGARGCRGDAHSDGVNAGIRTGAAQTKLKSKKKNDDPHPTHT